MIGLVVLHGLSNGLKEKSIGKKYVLLGVIKLISNLI